MFFSRLSVKQKVQFGRHAAREQLCKQAEMRKHAFVQQLHKRNNEVSHAEKRSDGGADQQTLLHLHGQSVTILAKWQDVLQPSSQNLQGQQGLASKASEMRAVRVGRNIPPFKKANRYILAWQCQTSCKSIHELQSAQLGSEDGPENFIYGVLGHSPAGTKTMHPVVKHCSRGIQHHTKTSIIQQRPRSEVEARTLLQRFHVPTCIMSFLKSPHDFYVRFSRMEIELCRDSSLQILHVLLRFGVSVGNDVLTQKAGLRACEADIIDRFIQRDIC